MRYQRKYKKALWCSLPNAPRQVEKKPKAIRRRSKKMTKRMVEYHKLKAQFLKDNPTCVVFPWDGWKQRPATQIHHRHGRLGSLLLDTRFWLAVSQTGHDWIHTHMEQARAYGFLCAKGQWNKPVPLE